MAVDLLNQELAEIMPESSWPINLSTNFQVTNPKTQIRLFHSLVIGPCALAYISSLNPAFIMLRIQLLKVQNPFSFARPIIFGKPTAGGVVAWQGYLLLTRTIAMQHLFAGPD